MKYYSGTIEAQNLYSTLVAHITAVQPGQSQPWWVEESSVQTDGAFTSVGSDGVSRIVFILREGVVGQKLVYGIAEDYTPGVANIAGTFSNSELSDLIYFNAVKVGTALVRYDLVVYPDNIILRIQGDRAFSDYKSQTIYCGMILRYDPTDSKGVAKVSHENNTKAASTATLLRDSNNNPLVGYNLITAVCPRNPAWGGNIILEPIHVSLTSEGFRGELAGIYNVNTTSLDNQIVTIGDKQFLVSYRTATGNNGFGQNSVAIRIS